MKIILQRVSQAEIVINGGEPKGIGKGLVALVGIGKDDTKEVIDYMIQKMLNLRIFNDEKGYFNYSLLDVSGDLLIVSNFTLYADCKKGRRPSFTDAAHPDQAIPLYDYLVEELQKTQVPLVTGEFGADMDIHLVNDGPVTIELDSAEILPKPNLERRDHRENS